MASSDQNTGPLISGRRVSGSPPETPGASNQAPPPIPRSPIDSLPSELLVHIFFTCRDAEPPYEDVTYLDLNGDPGFTPRLGWIRITHVCRRWRDVTLNSRLLWTRICFILGDRWCQEMFARSNPAPLTVDGNVNGAALSTLNRQASLVLDNLPRTSELHLIDRSPDLILALVDPMPELRVLNISGLQSYRPYGNTLPPGFLGGGVPRLQHLTVENPISFPWGATFMDNLSTFDLRFWHPSQYPHPPSFTTALDALDRMTRLEVLTLHGSLPANAPAAYHRVVQLPHLRTLSISGKLADCISLLQHLDAPTSARLIVRTPYEPDLQLFLSALSTYLHSSPSPAPARLPRRLVCEPRRERTSLYVLLDFADGPNTQTPNDPEHVAHRFGDVELYLHGVVTESAAAVMSAVCSNFVSPFARAIEFNVGRSCPWMARDWHSIMARATGVRDVRASDGAAASIALALGPSADDGAAVAPVLFPALHSLALVGVNFAEMVDFEGKACTRADALSAILRARASVGGPLPSLTLLHCNGFTDELQGTVTDVTRDGEIA